MSPLVRLVWVSLVVCSACPVARGAEDAPRVRFDGYQLVRLYVDTGDQITRLHDLGARLMSEGEGPGVVDYLLPPDALPGLESLGLTYKVLNDNVQKDIDAERALWEAQGVVAAQDPNWFTNYKDPNQVIAKLNAFHTDRPDLATVIDVGTSLQGRHIYGVRITGPGSNKPAVQFNGCHHAREWISVMVPMWIADKFVYTYDSDPNIHSLVNAVEFFIIPVVNVDGYVVVTEGRDPRWRKNTHGANRNGARDAYPEGVNLNRQYDFNWAFGGSPDSLSQQYRGPYPFSESEARAMRDLALRERFLLSISYHSMGEVVYYPWTWGGRKAPEDRLLTTIARELGGAIRTMKGDSTYKVEYGAGTVGQTYPWLYGRLGTFDFIVETGFGAHIFPPHEVDGIVENNVKGAWTIMRRASGPGLTGRVTDSGSGASLEATVWFPGIDTEDVTRRTSDSRFGRYRRLLEPGRYTLIVSRPGYAPALLRNVEVGASGWTTLNVPLDRSPVK